MKSICLYFQVHQPVRLKRYRFFDIGEDHYYYDEYTNQSILRKVAEKCYLPANDTLLEVIKEFGNQFKVAFSLTGIFIDQCEMYAPEVIESFKRLANTGCVEFLAETYSHSLVSLKNKEEFAHQVKQHSEKIERLFGQKPKVFRNTELIYSDGIGEIIADLGFEAMLTEGAKHILGWKSPNYLYYNAYNPRLKVLLRNFKLSDDIAFRFSNKGWSDYPLTTDKFVKWLNNIDNKEEIVNLFMDYETFGEHQWADSGIFEFLRQLPGAILKKTDFTFLNPSEVLRQFDPVAAINVPYPISWADEERDLTAWLGNELQDEAFNTLYEMSELVKKVNDEELNTDWKYLQTSDHFYYMCTKFFSDGQVHSYFTPYDNPYDAFINYLNVLTDFIDRLRKKSESLNIHQDISLAENELPENIEEVIKNYENALEKLKLKVQSKNSKNIETVDDFDLEDEANNEEQTIVEIEVESNTNSNKKELKIDGRMTVASLKKNFSDLFNATIRVYVGNNTGRGATLADDKERLGKLADERKSLGALGPFEIDESYTVAKFEKEFFEKYDIAVQVADADNKKLVNNKTLLSDL